MAFICCKCGRRADKEEAFCPQCGGRLEPDKSAVAAGAPASDAGKGQRWDLAVILFLCVAILLSYVLMRPHHQPISEPSAVATNSVNHQAGAVSPAEPAPAEIAVYKSYAECQVGDIFIFGA